MNKIKKISFIIIILIFSLLLLLSGCSKPECKKDSDCTSKACSSVMCINKKCKYTTRPNCCGNLICEKTANETKCLCPKDCGACNLDSGSKYLKVICTKTEECVTQMNMSQVKSETITRKLNARGGPALTVEFTADNPFNIDRSTLKMKISVDTMPAGASKVVLKKMEFYESAGKTDTSPLGDKDINKVLFSSEDKVDEEFYFTFPVEKELKKKILMKITTDTITPSPTGDRTTSGSVDGEVPFDFTFVNPSVARQCPASCDDNNACTNDQCNDDFFCEHTLKTGKCCGNYVCDVGEDQCSCPADCGSCEKNFGQYIQYSCIKGKCSSSLKADATSYTKVEELSVASASVTAKTTYDIPFNYDNSEFKINMEVLSFPTGLNSVKCDKMEMMNQQELIGEKAINLQFTKTGDIFDTTMKPDYAMVGVEDAKTVSIKLRCDSEKVQGQATVTAPLSIILNPGKTSFVRPD